MVESTGGMGSIVSVAARSRAISCRQWYAIYVNTFGFIGDAVTIGPPLSVYHVNLHCDASCNAIGSRAWLLEKWAVQNE